jgi:hypothetical protein
LQLVQSPPVGVSKRIACRVLQAVALTLPLLLYLIQLMRNLNCSSFEAGAMLEPALGAENRSSCQL